MSKMIKTALFPAILAMAVASATSANAWERHSSTTGPYGGTVSSQGSGHCAGGSCSSSQAYTGRYGNTVTRSGSTTCAGGVCNGTATYKGPAGNTVTRTRSFRRY